MNNIMPKFDNLDKMAKFLENTLPKKAQTRKLGCDIFTFQVEFIIEILLTSVGL